MEESLYAYSLSQSQDGWTWRLWDETGAVVAAGEAPDRLSAQRELEQAYERTADAEAAEPHDEPPADARAAARVRERLAGRHFAATPRTRAAQAEARRSARS